MGSWEINDPNRKERATCDCQCITEDVDGIRDGRLGNSLTLGLRRAFRHLDSVGWTEMVFSASCSNTARRRSKQTWEWSPTHKFNFEAIAKRPALTMEVQYRVQTTLYVVDAEG